MLPRIRTSACRSATGANDWTRAALATRYESSSSGKRYFATLTPSSSSFLRSQRRYLRSPELFSQAAAPKNSTPRYIRSALTGGTPFSRSSFSNRQSTSSFSSWCVAYSQSWTSAGVITIGSNGVYIACQASDGIVAPAELKQRVRPDVSAAFTG